MARTWKARFPGQDRREIDKGTRKKINPHRDRLRARQECRRVR